MTLEIPKSNFEGSQIEIPNVKTHTDPKSPEPNPCFTEFPSSPVVQHPATTPFTSSSSSAPAAMAPSPAPQPFYTELPPSLSEIFEELHQQVEALPMFRTRTGYRGEKTINHVQESQCVAFKKIIDLNEGFTARFTKIRKHFIFTNAFISGPKLQSLQKTSYRQQLLSNIRREGGSTATNLWGKI